METPIPRCDVCGKPIEGERDAVSLPSLDVDGVPEADVRAAIVDALRFAGPAEYSAAAELEADGEIVGHRDCLDDLSLVWVG